MCAELLGNRTPTRSLQASSGRFPSRCPHAMSLCRIPRGPCANQRVRSTGPSLDHKQASLRKLLGWNGRKGSFSGLLGRSHTRTTLAGPRSDGFGTSHTPGPVRPANRSPILPVQAPRQPLGRRGASLQKDPIPHFMRAMGIRPEVERPGPTGDPQCFDVAGSPGGVLAAPAHRDTVSLGGGAEWSDCHGADRAPQAQGQGAPYRVCG